MAANYSNIATNQVTVSNTITIANVTTDGSNNRLLFLAVCVFNSANSICNHTVATYGANNFTIGVNTIVATNYHWFTGYIADPPANSNANITFTVDITANVILAHSYSLYNANRTVFSNATANSVANLVSMAANGIAHVANSSLLAFAFAEVDFVGCSEGSLYAGVGAVNAANSVTSRTPASPATLLGDVLLATCGVRHVESHNWAGTGWTKLVQANYSTTWSVSIGYRQSNGANANPTISWTTAANAQARVWSFKGGRGNSTNNVGFISSNTGNTSPHTQVATNTTRDNSRLVYVDHSRANTAVGATANRTERFDAGGAAGPYRLAAGDGFCASNGTSLGSLSCTGAVNNWCQGDIELMAALFASAPTYAEGGNASVGYWSRCFARWDANSGSDYQTIAFTKATNTAAGSVLNIQILEDLSGPPANIKVPLFRFNQAQHWG